MKANILTPGIVFSIDELLRNSESTAAELLVKSTGLSFRDEADRAVIQAMKAEQSVLPKTVSFIRKHSAKPTPAARRKGVAK